MPMPAVPLSLGLFVDLVGGFGSGSLVSQKSEGIFS